MKTNVTAARRWIRSLLVLAVLPMWQAAQAVPSYSRQTNTECAACHIGAFGPHLTPYGIRFKLGGYTDSDGKSGKIPVSLITQLSSTQRDQGSSDTRVTNVDLYLAGKLFDNVGSFAKISHAESVTATDYTQLDDVDLRFAKETRLGGRELVWGLSLNNHPGVQDPIDSMPAWGFGAIGPGRDFVQKTRTGTLLNKWQGGLAHRVIGLTGYAYADKHWYGEIGTYKSMSLSAQDKLGLPAYQAGADVGDPGRLSNTLYWRAAYLHDWKTQFVSFGFTGLQTNLQPDRVGPSDRIRDLGADVMYEYLGTREHTVQVRAAYIVEQRNYGTQPTLSFFPPAFGGPTGLPTGKVKEATASGTYFYQNTVGFMVGRTWSKTNEDAARYLPFGQASSQFLFLAPFWNVWGKEGDAVPVGTNLQLSVIVLRFDKFNGGANNVFGPGTARAKDLNSVIMYAKLGF